MNSIVIIFMVVATVFALATLVYVAIDIACEKREKKESEQKKD